MATGDKRTDKKKYGFGGSRNYGQITDEMEQKCVGKKFKQINRLGPWRQKYVLGSSRNYG